MFHEGRPSVVKDRLYHSEKGAFNDNIQTSSTVYTAYVHLCRARTNPSAKQLHTVLARGTGVDVTGCIILLQV